MLCCARLKVLSIAYMSPLNTPNSQYTVEYLSAKDASASHTATRTTTGTNRSVNSDSAFSRLCRAMATVRHDHYIPHPITSIDRSVDSSVEPLLLGASAPGPNRSVITRVTPCSSPARTVLPAVSARYPGAPDTP